jgi:hypothetical protein
MAAKPPGADIIPQSLKVGTVGGPTGVSAAAADRFFFVCHTAAGPLSLPAEPRLHLWTAERLSDAAIDARLDWRDFETLVDLIFSRGGWQRSSVLGKNQADVDLILSQPTIGETAWVQIKSGTSQAELDDYVGGFRRDGSCDRSFFVCHSPAGALSLPAQPRLHLWAAERLSDAAIDAGMFNWLIDRTR